MFSRSRKETAAVISLLGDLPRGDPKRAPRRQPGAFTPPDAHFKQPDPTAEPDFAYRPDGGLFLGVVDAAPEGRGRTLGVTGGQAVGITTDQHIVTIAGSRASKGRSMIVPNMLRYPGSVLATDPKGELATITARQRARGLGQDVHVLDPFEVTKGAAVPLRVRSGFNPIAAMRENSLVEDAGLIADALVVAGGNDPHWDESARAFIEGVILHVRTYPMYRKHAASLLTVRNLVGGKAKGPDGKESMSAVETMMRENSAENGMVQLAAANFFDRTERERSSVLSTARRHLKFLDYPGIQAVVQRHSLDLDDLKRKRTSIYLCLPARHMGTCSRWLRLFVNLALQAVERVEGKPAGGMPILFCLDEFAQLGHMRQIEDAAGQIAGFGVTLWPILQDLGQLKALYKDRWETFLGNSGVQQFFGNSDVTTLEYISKRLGRTSIDMTRLTDTTAAQRADGGTGESKSTEVHDLLTVDEVARFFRRYDPYLRQLVIAPDAEAPLILQRAYYDHHSLFAGLWDRIPE
jgi:type IV secretion system protein VirD4